jgi:hypothetical protein
MMLSTLVAWSFLSWMAHEAPKCAAVTMQPLSATIEWCKHGPAWVASFDGFVGIAACNDYDIYVAFDDDTVLHANSVAEVQGILRG